MINQENLTNKLKTAPLISLMLFLIVAIFLTTLILKYKQERRLKAASTPDTILSLLSPDAGNTISPNQEFTVNLMLDPKAKNISGVEAHLNYPVNLLDLIQTPVINTSIFPNQLQNNSNLQTGAIDIAAGIALPQQASPTPNQLNPTPTIPIIPTNTIVPINTITPIYTITPTSPVNPTPLPTATPGNNSPVPTIVLPVDSIGGRISVSVPVNQVYVNLYQANGAFIKKVNATATSDPLAYDYVFEELSEPQYRVEAWAIIGQVHYGQDYSVCNNWYCLANISDYRNLAITIPNGNQIISGNFTVNNPNSVGLNSLYIDLRASDNSHRQRISFSVNTTITNINSNFNFTRTTNGMTYHISALAITLSGNQYNNSLSNCTNLDGISCVIISPATQNLSIDLSGATASRKKYQTRDNLSINLPFLPVKSVNAQTNAILVASMKFRLKANAASLANSATIAFNPQTSIVTEITAPDVAPINVLLSTNNLTLAIGSNITPTPGSITPTIPPNTPLVKFKIKFRSVSTNIGEQKVKLIVKNETNNYSGEFVNVPVVYDSATNGYMTRADYPLVNVPAGSGYKIYVKGPKHLAKGFKNITLTSSSTNAFDWTSQELEPGDLPPQDGVINSQDISRLIELLGNLYPNQSQLDTGDLNFDGAINGADTNELILTLSTKYDESQY